MASRLPFPCPQRRRLASDPPRKGGTSHGRRSGSEGRPGCADEGRAAVRALPHARRPATRRRWSRPRGRITASASRRGTSVATASGRPCWRAPTATVIASRFARARPCRSARPEPSVKRGRAQRGPSRVERDSLGARYASPRRALYGVFTERARDTFRLSGRPPHPALLRGYARIKQGAALGRMRRLGLLPRRLGRRPSIGRRTAWSTGDVADAACHRHPASRRRHAGAHERERGRWRTSPTNGSVAGAGASTPLHPEQSRQPRRSPRTT